MINVTFVCLGNICRSPMAEFMFKDKIKKLGKEDLFSVSSRGVSDEEEGNPVYFQAKKELAKHGIFCDGKTARRFALVDYIDNDFVVCMESRHAYAIRSKYRRGEEEKVFCLLDFVGGGEISDPWYTGNFEFAYNDIDRGLEGFIQYLKENGYL